MQNQEVSNKITTMRLQRRLLLILIIPLCALGIINAWVDYRSASAKANEQEQQLRQLIPLLADSIIAVSTHDNDPPILLLAHPVRGFLKERKAQITYRIHTLKKQLLHGNSALPATIPTDHQAHFFDHNIKSTKYRSLAQRVPTVAGDVVIVVADASDPRKNWLQQIALKVLLPNIIMIVLVGFFVGWAVRQAMRPLHNLISAVQKRSPQDLSSIEEHNTPLEIRPLIAALNRLFVKVNQQTENQRRFIADAAHQLRTPLAGLQAQIEAWLEALKQPQETPNSPSIHDVHLVHTHTAHDIVQLPLPELHRLHTATKRTSQLVHQLLSLSRAEAAEPLTPEHMQAINLRALCEDVLDRYWDMAAQKNIDLGLEADNIYIHGHALWLHELLGNLLDNALIYTPDNGMVTVRCGIKPCAENIETMCAFIEVEDNGIGIAVEDRPHVIERFYRAPHAHAQGTGLGLAIANEIAQRHHSQLIFSDGIAHEDSTSCGLCITVLFAAELRIENNTLANNNPPDNPVADQTQSSPSHNIPTP